MSDLDSHLRLKAVRAKDLEVISGALQDAIVPIGDISFEPGPGQFVFVANRFCWETTGDTKSSAPGSRVHAGVTFFNVVEVKRRGIDFRNRTTFRGLRRTLADAVAAPARGRLTSPVIRNRQNRGIRGCSTGSRGR
jgi:hypothetical protein